MIAWFSANLGTIVVGLIVAGIVAAVLRGMWRDKKAGKRSCGGDCASCGGCHCK